MFHALQLRQLSRLCFVVLALNLAIQSFAATYYVRPGASGNGSDWANAYGSLPSTLRRGSTYYLAAGNYPSRSFSDGEFGTSVITIKKATTSDHGTNTGWNDSYAGQAVFAADWVFHTGYYVIDGQTRNEADWQQIDAYGIKINISSTPRFDQVGAIMIPDEVSKITLRRIAMSGPGCGYGQVSGRGINIASAGASDITIRQCLIRNAAVPILTRKINGMKVDSCWIGPNYAIYDGYHCEAWSDSGSENVTISNNRFVDIMNTAFITLISTSGGAPHQNWKIYGNVFMHSPKSGWDGWGVGNGIIAVINNNTAVGWRVFNNTIVNTRGWFASIELPGTDNAVFNNIWYHLGYNSKGGPTGIGITATTKSNNWILLANGAKINTTAIGIDDVFGSVDPFIDWENGDLRLNPNAKGLLPIDNGTPSADGSGNVDAAGTTRGADGKWDIGALEYTDDINLVPPSPPVNIRNTINTQSRVELQWESPVDSPVLISRYKVFRDGSVINETTGLKFTDATVQPAKYYHYEVRSESYAGILSDRNDALDLVTPDPDLDAPTVPRSFRGAVLSCCDIDLAWDPSTDDQYVTGYNLFRNGHKIAVTQQTSYSETDLSPSTAYTYQVSAFDDAGNTSAAPEISLRTRDLPPIKQGLVAAYEFDEGSGWIVHDRTGMGNDGMVNFIAGPAWRVGRAGGCLQFNGQTDVVEIPAAPSLDLCDGMTLTAWVCPTQTLVGWQHVVAKEGDGVTLAYYLAANAGHTNTPWAGFNIENSWLSIGGGTTLPANQWSHIASTYDGRNLRVYVNGYRVACYYVGKAIECTGGRLHLGGNELEQFYQGMIDQVLIYNRALAPAEIINIYQLLGGPMSCIQNWSHYR